MRAAASPSGITGGGRTHSFRASGFTRHYETFAEQLQIIAQLALGFALAAWRRRAQSREGGGSQEGRSVEGRSVEERSVEGQSEEGRSVEERSVEERSRRRWRRW